MEKVQGRITVVVMCLLAVVLLMALVFTISNLEGDRIESLATVAEHRWDPIAPVPDPTLIALEELRKEVHGGSLAVCFFLGAILATLWRTKT